MESVIPEDSPLAGYLEGVADATIAEAPRTPDSPTASFAPRGLPHRKRLSRLRDRIKPLSFASTRLAGPLSPRNGKRYSAIISDQLIGPSGGGVLDQFRYLIVTSQLLNARPNAHGYIPGQKLQPLSNRPIAVNGASHTLAGLSGTAAIAYIVAWLVHQLRNLAIRQPRAWQVVLVLTVGAAAILAAYFLIRRHWLAYVRKRLIAVTTSFTTQAQTFDAASSAAMQLVQEVELVSRGYRISTPMPPASRIEEQSQIKRCLRLRRTLYRNSTTLLKNYIDCFQRAKGFTIQLDFERYCDVYEVTRSDLDGILTWLDDEDPLDSESLKSLQLTLQRLYLARKVFLCALLALDAGTASEISQWNLVADCVNQLSTTCHESTLAVDGILAEETKGPREEKLLEPVSPTRERVKTQLRRFTTLSQGIRELQAKIYLLHDDSDRALSTSDDVAELGPKLLEQYDSFGADLRNLVQEWEEGRQALVSNINKRESRASLSPVGLSFSRSTTPSSLSGRTASGGSPAEALKILNGEMTPSLLADSSDEELFEAVALPRARSTFTREERIAKMKEERMHQAVVRENADASRHMVKELESVIKLRPRPKGVRTSL